MLHLARQVQSYGIPVNMSHTVTTSTVSRYDPAPATVQTSLRRIGQATSRHGGNLPRSHPRSLQVSTSSRHSQRTARRHGQAENNGRMARRMRRKEGHDERRAVSAVLHPLVSKRDSSTLVCSYHCGYPTQAPSDEHSNLSAVPPAQHEWADITSAQSTGRGAPHASRRISARAEQSTRHAASWCVCNH